MRFRLFTVLAALVMGFSLLSAAQAQSEPAAPIHIVPRAAPTTHVDVRPLLPPGVANFSAEKATAAYMARISPADRARSDAYFEGGYVLLVVDLIYALIVAGILLWAQISARMRDVADFIGQSLIGRLLVYTMILIPVCLLLLPILTLFHLPMAPLTALILAIPAVFGLSRVGWMQDMVEKFAVSRFMQVPLYVVQYALLTTVLMLPLTIYEQFFREHKFGLSNQTFAQWAIEFAISSGVQILSMMLLLTIVYAVIRAAKRAWWAWGAGITVIFLIIGVAIAPVYIAPLTNKYTPLPESGLRNAILSMARANEIPADNVYMSDASKQSKRISANVSGMFGTTRITLNDNLLNRCTPSEVLAVMGHEMGHYVLNHIAILITWMGLLIVVAFWFVDRTFHGLISVFGGNWDVRSIEDPAGLPLAFALIGVFMFLATPVTNTIVRTAEVQADIFGYNAVRQPDAFATVSLKLAEYRKMDPSPLEEFVFFDHPSGKNRILRAMRWKKEHLYDQDVMNGPLSPQ